MTTIGYATLQVIPSIRGLSAVMDKQLGGLKGIGSKAGRDLGKAMADSLNASKDVEKATERKAKAADKLADALGKVKVAQANLTQAEARGNIAGRARAVEQLATAQRRVATETRTATSATKELESATKRAAAAAKNVGSGSGSKFGAFGNVLFGSGGPSGMSGAVSGAMSTAGKAGLVGLAAVLTVGAGAAIMKPFVSGMQASFEAGVEFDKVVNNFKGVTNASVADVARMRAEARKLGADTQLAGVSSSTAAVAMTELAKAGFSTSEAMTAARGTVQLATAAQIDGAQAASILGSAMNTFQIKAEDAGRVTNDLAAAASASSIDIPDLSLALQQGGSVAAGFGMNIEDTIATLATFAQMGVRGSDAGTLMKSSLLATLSPTEKQTGAMDELNLSLEDANGNFVGYREMMNQLSTASKSMTQTQFNTAASTIFGTDAVRASMFAANEAVPIWDKMRESQNDAGAASRMAAAQMEGVPGVLEGASNALENVKLSAYDAFSAIAEALGGKALGGLNDLGTAMSTHMPQMIEFFSQLAGNALITMGAIGEFASGSLNVLSVFAEVSGRALGLVSDGFGLLMQGAGAVVGLFDKDMGDSLTRAGGQMRTFADTMYDQGANMRKWATAIGNGSDTLGQLGTDIKDAGAQAAKAQRFTDALGGSIAEIHGTDVVITDNTPEVLAKIDKTKYEITHLPNGDIKLTPKTQEASDAINAWRVQQGQKPVEVPVTVKANAQQIQDAITRAMPVPGQYTPPAGPGGSNPFAGYPPRAAGGIFDVWKSVASFANGKLPSQAMIQPPVGGSGLVQWAEPSTGGEAFIPLNGGKRSLDIWAETGKRLGMLRSFAGGGITSEISEISQIAKQFDLQLTSGARPGDGTSFHASGQAGDFSNGSGNTPQMLAFAEYMATNYGGQLAELIYDAPGFDMTVKDGKPVGPFGAFYTMAQAGDHTDHVHIAVRQGTPLNLGSKTFDTGSNASSAAPLSATSAGVGPNGQSGSYSAPDAKSVREADQRIADADARVAEQEADVRALKADASEAEKLRSQNQLDKAKREASDARADRDEVMRGKFTADSGSSSGSGSSTGTSILSIPSAFSGLAGIGLDGLGIKTKVGPNTPERTFDLGGVASAAVGGQVSSMLDVFGVGDSPPWLNALSTFASGVSIGGGSAAPLSAQDNARDNAAVVAAAAGDPGNVHGTRANQAPGPTYNITARDTEDAFIRANRLEREKSAAKLSHL